MYKEIETITDEKILDKIFALIALYIEKGFEIIGGENFDPITILFDDTKKTIDSIINEAKIAVIDEKIAALKTEYEAVKNRKYKTSKKVVEVGDGGFNGGFYNVNFINRRRKEKILANIIANIEDLEIEKKEIV